ncbi:MAG: hypothetical protein ABI281_14240, partial [Caldimonas sp.]
RPAITAAAAVHHLIPDDDDLLAMLDAGAGAAHATQFPRTAAAATDDILALFDAPADTPFATLGEADSQAVPPAGKGEDFRRASASEPDLLDLFADTPATPAPGKTGRDDEH